MTEHTKRSMRALPRGVLGVACYRPKHEVNVGSLWRSSFLYGADFIATVGRRYVYQASDTPHTSKHVPLLHYKDIDDLIDHLPHGCPLVGLELDQRAVPLSKFRWPSNSVLLVGAEDAGLPPRVLDKCHYVVQIESAQPWSMNVSVAGSIALRERYLQGLR